MQCVCKRVALSLEQISEYLNKEDLGHCSWLQYDYVDHYEIWYTDVRNAVSGPAAADSIVEQSPRSVLFDGARPKDAAVTGPVAADSIVKEAPRSVPFGGARPRDAAASTTELYTPTGPFPGRRVSCGLRFLFWAI